MGGKFMKEEEYNLLPKQVVSDKAITKKAPNMKEEISMELAEMGNMTPKKEPMTPNARDKREREKWYNK